MNFQNIYKCYRQKGNCNICNSLSNIICKNCNYNKEMWLCTNHWKQHSIESHNNKMNQYIQKVYYYKNINEHQH